MKKAGRFLALIMCIVLTAVLMGACSGKSDDEAGTSSDSKDQTPEEKIVRLAESSNGHVFNMIAEDQGYLKDEGIKVYYVHVRTDAEVFEGIENGTIDVASNSGTNLPLQQIAEGQDLTIFAGYMLTGCMPIFCKADTDWYGIDNLIGATFACEPNLYAVTGPLLDKGYNPMNDVKWYNPETQEERIEAVKSGKVKYALVGTSLNYVINQDPELKVCTYASDILPDYSCCRVEAKTEWVNKNPNTVKALLRAWLRAMAYYDAHHDETVALVAEKTGYSEAYVRAYLDNPHCVLNLDPMKSSVKRGWDYLDRMNLFGEKSKEISIDDHINVDLYKEVLDECQEKYGKENPKFFERMQSIFALNDF